MRLIKGNIFPVLVILTFILAFTLRFYNLSSIPNGLYPDETAIGYNAYSILQTGKDEYGSKMPLYFKSFDDYKLPVYIYSTALTEKIFGVNAFAVRFPSALMGSLAVIALFFLVKLLTKNRWLSLTTALVLALNPWHLFFSRAGYEVNVATSLMLFGILFFILAIQRPKKYLFFIFSILYFLLAVYTYNVTRLISPIMLLGLCLLYYKDLLKYSYVKLLSLAVLFGIGLLPFIITFITLQSQPGFAAHDDALLIGKVARTDYILTRSYFVNLPTIIQKVMFNYIFLVAFAYLKNLVSFFSSSFFFIAGADRPNENIAGGLAMFYYFDLPFIIYGGYRIIRNRINNLYPFLLWFLVMYFVGSIIKSVPNGTRTYAVVIPLVVFGSYGLYYLLQQVLLFKKKLIKYLILSFSSCVIVYSILFYLLSYFVRFPIELAQDWRSEDKRTVQYIQSIEKNYDKIVFDTSAGFYYTSLLFYGKIDPSFHQAHAIYSLHGLVNGVDKDGKYEFRKVDWTKEKSTAKTLYITGKDEIPPNSETKNIIFYPTRPVAIFFDRQIAQYPTTDTAYVFSTIKPTP